MNVNLEEYKDFTTKEIVAKMQAGEIAPPPKGQERQRFFEFANAAPGSDVRLGFLKSPEEASAPASDEGAVKTDVPPEGEKPMEQPKDAPPPPPPAEGGKKEWYEDLGYSSEQEAREKLKEQNELVREYKTKYDRFNAERGVLGQENKTLKERLKILENERKALKKEAPKEKAFDIKRPKRPDIKRPKPSDFEDGEIDDEYQAAREKFESAMDQYNADMDTWYDKFEEHNRKIVDKINAIDDLRGKVSQVDEYYQATSANEHKAKRDSAWNAVWDTAKKITDTYSLDMGVSAREISDAYGVLNSESASVEQKQMADKFVKSLSEKDKQGYNAVKKVLEKYYDFSTGMPEAKMARVEAAIMEAGLDQQLKPRPTSTLTPEEEKKLREQKAREEQGSVSAPSSSAMSSNDGLLSQHQTMDEKKARFAELAKQYSEAANAGESYARAFESSPQFKEYRELRLALGIKIPQSFKRYQFA